MAKRLLVEGLDWGVSEGQLMRVFAPFGDLDEARIAMDWETGRSRGFGYITFRDSGDAEAAIAGLDGQKLAGKTLRVMVAPDQGGGAARSTYRGGDYGNVEPGADAKNGPGYRNADFDGGRRPAAGEPRTDRKLFRSADFGYVEREAEPPAAQGKEPAGPAAAHDPARPSAAGKAGGAAAAAAKHPRKGREADPEDALDEEEKANRAKYGGWKEGGENDGGFGGGGNPFG